MSRYENRGPPSKRGRMDRGGAAGRANLSEHEIEEELAKFDPNVRPNNVLLFTVLNADYPIDVSIIYKVCSPIGKVDRIVIFRRGYVIHAMVEFNNMDSADQAKRNLHGCDVYSGCCTLKVEYAKTDRLQVKKNDDLSWDYTDEFQRGGGAMNSRAERTVLLTEPPKMSIGGGGNNNMAMDVMRGGSMGGGGHMGGGGMGGGMDRGMGGGGMGGMNSGMGGNSFNGMASSLMGAIAGGMGGMSMGGGGGMDMNRGNDGFHGHSSISGMAMNNFGGGQNYGGHNSYGGGNQMHSNLRGRSSVAMVYGLEPDKFNCQRVFNLFCQYGNIRKVSFLKSKEGCVMMEMAEAEGVQNIIDNISNSAIFGLKVRVDWSKKEFVTEVRNPHNLADGSPSYVSFEQDRNNRFDTPERAAKNRILPATKFLHFYNVPKLEEGDLETVFTDKGAPSPTRIKFFPSSNERSSSGIVEFDSTQEACEAIVMCNHSKIDGDKFPYIMKLCFSQGPRDSRRTRD